jgi:hypothetical protein
MERGKGTYEDEKAQVNDFAEKKRGTSFRKSLLSFGL